MTLKKRIIAIGMIGVLAAGAFCVGHFGLAIKPVEKEEVVEEVSPFGKRDTLYLWYADEALTDYLNSIAVAYSEYQEEARVVPVYTSGLEYLETINQASQNADETPDLFIVSNDSLEKAYLGGLASEVQKTDQVKPFEEIFPEAAMRAVTYKEKPIAYPFYFETSCFLYNKTYLYDWAKAQIEAEADAADGEAAQGMIDSGEVVPVASDKDEIKTDDKEKKEGEETSETEQSAEETDVETVEEAVVEEDGALEEEVTRRVEEILPKKIDDILELADVYDAPEQVEAVFKWDVSDIFYNYFFVGNYINVGGPNGDQANDIHIYNENAIRAMKVYQNLNQFFSIDTKEISYAGVLQDFLDGKLVYTVATSDAIAKLETAKEEGLFNYEYGISKMPDVSDELTSASLSVTQCVVVNGYSSHKKLANDFAAYLTQIDTDNLYTRTGKMPVYATGDTYDNPNMEAFKSEYEESVPMPKMIETSNFWVELEIAFAKIWDGEDANDDLKALSEKIMSQVLGETYTEEYISLPVEEIPVEEEFVEEEAEESTDDSNS